ncbi:LacI family DNA-binding transcriptional regulator [Aquimarina gracilis]|uniref:LacI family DNA-binding transcriptional regulator n=1 Tax=Aquimarina gracilis TaxID=874422 RepID=A0ABU5ZQM5_9FLAO|nr:LacI family DNA-binding transcriptional regulator [Aquimarina gracilis]MEB3344380.1 LacI family DNA-binding transcriptional regulator [Aquimarina gracilis]
MASKKATIHDIAKELNITASTVSRALNNNPRISEATKKAVLGMAKDLNYQPNNLAAALRKGKSQLIGIIVPTINRSFFSSVIRGVEEVANKLNYRVIVSQSNEDVDNEIATLNALLNARVDGVLVSIGKNTDRFEHYKDLMERGIPLVLFDRTTNEVGTSQVVIDDYLGGYLATEHLIKQGCKKIVHFTNLKQVNIYKERYRGYLEALRDNDIPFDESLVYQSDMQLVDGRNCTEQLLASHKKFDAIFSASDYAAVGALQILKENGVKVPEDVALVGFSNEPFTSFTDPSLTTVSQFPIEMGQAAAESFFEILEAKKKKFIPQKTVLQPELIIRDSSLKSGK